MITQIKGNIFTTSCDVIGHGVNCRGGFGSGLAGSIAEVLPQVRNAYLKKFQRTGWNLGDVQIVKINQEFSPYYNMQGLEFRYVANIASQYDFGGEEVHCNYGAIRKGLRSLFGWCSQKDYTVALPRIGCGLANGDWKKVKKIITEEANLDGVDVEIYSL